MSKVLLDTDVLIDLLRGRAATKGVATGNVRDYPMPEVTLLPARR